MSDPKSTPELTCWDCGASNHPGSSECWLCQHRDWRRYPGVRPRQTIPPAPRGALSSIAGWMVLIALIAVFAGIFRAAPGLAIALLVCFLPAWAITSVKAGRRRRRAEPMSGMERALWIIGLTILIPIVVITALGIALFAFCMFMSR
ncbi:MAG: hypothetical protein ACLQGP_27075 [Isosphaeraceae bacterium]